MSRGKDSRHCSDYAGEQCGNVARSNWHVESQRLQLIIGRTTMVVQVTRWRHCLRHGEKVKCMRGSSGDERSWRAGRLVDEGIRTARRGNAYVSSSSHDGMQLSYASSRYGVQTQRTGGKIQRAQNAAKGTLKAFGARQMFQPLGGRCSRTTQASSFKRDPLPSPPRRAVQSTLSPARSSFLILGTADSSVAPPGPAASFLMLVRWAR